MSIHTEDNSHSRENCGNQLADKAVLQSILMIDSVAKYIYVNLVENCMKV